MFSPSSRTRAKGAGVLLFLFVVLASYLTYVHNFPNPPSLFWDENYHIASAQKYLNGIHFLEPHPPLAKMLIAAGEAILQRNPVNDQFAGADYGKNLPEGFDFTGYRLFPVLFGWLTAPVLFLIFLLLTRNALFAALFSFLYVFDNALIVHSRSAMLDSTMIFFTALTILFYLLTVQYRERSRAFAIAVVCFGASFALLMATKVLGLVLVLMVPLAFAQLYPSWTRIWKLFALFTASFAVVYLSVWQIHFSLTKTVNPVLPDGGYYHVSDEFKRLRDAGKTNLPIMLRDSWKFLGHYAGGVPRLDMCKTNENGSPWFLWPIGGRSINFRWETPDGNADRYLYLQVNPAAWGLGLLGVLLSGAIVLASVLFPPVRKHLTQYVPMLTFLGLWLAYMIAVARIGRVMYLYHYFIPLLFSFILFALAFTELRQIWNWKLNDRRKTGVLLALAFLIFASFQFYRPFTYYTLLTDKQVEHRALVPSWELHCATCPRESRLVNPSREG